MCCADFHNYQDKGSQTVDDGSQTIDDIIEELRLMDKETIMRYLQTTERESTTDSSVMFHTELKIVEESDDRPNSPTADRAVPSDELESAVVTSCDKLESAVVPPDHQHVGSQMAHLSTEGEELDPKFVQRPQDLTVLEGEPIVLECSVSGTDPIGKNFLAAVKYCFSS